MVIAFPQQAITIFDHKVCDTVKRSNAMNHITVSKQKRLEELQTQYNQMVKDSSDAVATDKGESADAQQMRYLENSYDKVSMKTEEAKQVQRVYLDIKARFEQVRFLLLFFFFFFFAGDGGGMQKKKRPVISIIFRN